MDLYLESLDLGLVIKVERNQAPDETLVDVCLLFSKRQVVGPYIRIQGDGPVVTEPRYLVALRMAHNCLGLQVRIGI